MLMKQRLAARREIPMQIPYCKFSRHTDSCSLPPDDSEGQALIVIQTDRQHCMHTKTDMQRQAHLLTDRQH